MSTIVKINKIKFPNITITFDDGLVSTINMVDYFSDVDRPLVKKILKNEASFNTVTLDFGALLWYKVGFDPDEMYEYAKEHGHKASANLKKTLKKLIEKNEY